MYNYLCMNNENGGIPMQKKTVALTGSSGTMGWAGFQELYAKKDELALLNRMEKYSHNHLLFLHDFSVPFDDNISERDLRKAKNRQKMAGGFRKDSGHEMYCDIMSIIETLKKRKMGIIENIKMLFMGTPAIF